MALLLTKNVSVLTNYTHFANIFSKKLAEILSKRTGINKHATKLGNGKQPPYKPIYSLGLVELETLKTYIETNLTNNFIQSSNSPFGALILFV